MTHDLPPQPQRANPLLAPITALQFLTFIPPLVGRAFTAQELGQATGFFPLVGLLIGGLLAGVNLLLQPVFPPTVLAALLLALWVGASGALHLDGFLDACDGLLGGFTPEERLRILKDERKGAFAVAGGILLMLIKFTALQACLARPAALILAPVLGRWCMTLSIFTCPYARPQGLGRAMKEHTTVVQAALASLLALAGAWALAGVWGLGAGGVALVVGGAAALFALQRIPGLTGDIYGAINELVETAVLLLFSTLLIA